VVCFPHLKTASIGSHIAYALEHLKTDNAAWDLRAKALLAVGYCTVSSFSPCPNCQAPKFHARAREPLVLQAFHAFAGAQNRQA
jgi:hypothetical protein